MTSTPSNTPDGPILDLDLRDWEHTVGDVTVVGTWLLSTKRPVMCLIPSRMMPTPDRVTPCLVPLDLAYQWDEHTGDGAFSALQSVIFADALGLNAMEPRNVLFVTTLIRDHLGDLLKMGPFPATEMRPVADVLITDSLTGRTTEAEISENV